MALFVVVFTALGYAWLGQPDAWHLGPKHHSTTTTIDMPTGGANAITAEPTQADAAAILNEMEAHVKAQPQDGAAWATLARAYAATRRHADAVVAYRKALSLQPKHAPSQPQALLLADLADALSVTQNFSMAGEPTRLVQQALVVDPKNFKALSLSGMVHYEKQAFREAAQAWSQAIANAPPGNPSLVAQMVQARNEATQRAGMSMDELGKQAEASAQTQTRVSGRVSLSAAVMGQVSPDDTVFIFARAVQGSRMPLAILRKQVKDLPVDFTLDDSMAMSPQNALSSVQHVVVGARVSRSGQAMPQVGDWQGVSQPVAVGSESVLVEIAQAIGR
jgi:cytochrome c-type biogenesis protein CcmH